MSTNETNYRNVVCAYNIASRELKDLSETLERLEEKYLGELSTPAKVQARMINLQERQRTLRAQIAEYRVRMAALKA